MFPKPLKWIALIVLVGATAAAGMAYRHHQRYKHFAVHEPGMMYRSAWLEPDVFSELIEEYQFRAIVNLCEPGEMGEERWNGERAAVRNAGAKLFEVPMPTSVDIDDPALEKHIELLKNPDNYPMLVHCQHGVTRTAKFLAMYDIVFRHMSAADSLAAQPLFGRRDHNVNIRAFVKNFEAEHTERRPIASSESLDVLRQ
jgi:hypothetical protein